MVESIGELRKICAKSHDPDEKRYLLIFWRKISIYFTKLLLYTSITANQVTILGTLVGIFAGVLLAYGNLYTLIGALLLHLSFIFDLVDGEVARYRKSGSIIGIYLELLNHHIVIPFVLICISFMVYDVFHDPKVFIFGFSAVLSQWLIMIVREGKYITVFLQHKATKERSSKDHPRVYYKEKISPGVLFEEEKIYLTSKSHIIFKISKIILESHGIILTSNIILFASLIDMAIPWIVIWPLKLNVMYLFLIFRGTFSHFLWLGLMFLTVKTKSLDKMYSLLFN